MNCYYVFVHGRLDWTGVAPVTDTDCSQPEGFYCHRYVLASSAQAAQVEAFRRVRENLEKDGWLSSTGAKLELEAEEVTPAPIYKLLTPDNPGHSFYNEA